MNCVGKAPKILFAIAAALAAVGSAFAWQMPWREYPGQDNIEIPPDYKVQAEWVFARLDRKSTRLNSSHSQQSRMPSSA